MQMWPDRATKPAKASALHSEGFLFCGAGQPTNQVNERGDLIQIAAPDASSNAAKPEKQMNALARFRPPATKTVRPSPFNFELASVVLFSRNRQRVVLRALLRATGTRAVHSMTDRGGRHE